MKQQIVCFILFAFLIVVSCELEEIAKINDKSHHMNNKIQNISKILITELESYFNNLTLALKNVSEDHILSFHISDKLPKVIEAYKALNFQYLEDLKTCDDLKLKNASFFLKFNKFKFVEYEEHKGKRNNLRNF